MKRTNKTSYAALAFLLILAGFATSCADRDVYDPNGGKNKLPAPESFFGFETRGDVELSVNYNAPGFKTIIEVYDQNPMEENDLTKKEGVTSIFAAYTDADGKFEGKMYIPTSVKEAYLYTNRWGLPLCVKLEATTDGWKYDATTQQAQKKAATTRAQYDYLQGAAAPYALKGNEDESLYSAFLFDSWGYVADNEITKNSTYKGEKLGDISKRIEAYFDTYTGRRSDLLKPADITNIKVTKQGTLDLVYLDERAQYLNSFGYYYYEAGNAPKTEEQLKAIKKYIVIPDVEKEANCVKTGYTFRLKYFGKSGTDAATEVFPENTVIGWFLVSNGWNMYYNDIKHWSDGVYRNFFLSNDVDENMRFVAVKDQKTGIVVLGCEDQPEKLFNREKEDYSDVLFFVKSDDAELDHEGKPEIPDKNPEDKVGTRIVSGTLAFEDIWPSGGDYDLNDVVIEYERAIDFDGNNNALAVTETFIPVQKIGSASYDNYFAYQVKSSLGTVKLPENCISESVTNSIVINKGVKEVREQKFVITRDVKSLKLSTDAVVADFNPYIIVGGYKTENRIEVHLPKYSATSLADMSKVGTADDAYYINKKGDFPFAIDIPILGFNVVTERSRIDAAGEYPAFKTWAESEGTLAKDWYLTGKK